MQYRLENALKYEQPSRYIVQSEEYSADMSLVPVLTAGKTFILGYTEENQGICKASSAPVILFDDFTADSRYIDFDFKVKSSAVKILHKINTDDNLKYFYYAMQAIKYKPFSHKRVWISEYSKFTVKQRTPNEQNSIVTMLDKLENAIKNAKQRLIELDELIKSRFIEMFENKNFEEKKWFDVVNIINGKDYKKIPNISGTYPIYGSGGYMGIRCDQYLCNENSVIIGRKGNVTNPIFVKEKYWNVDTAFGIETKDCLNPYYFYYHTLTVDLSSLVSGAAIPSMTKTSLQKIKIIVPPIELQNTFAEFVKQVDKSKFIVQKQIEDLQELLDGKMDEYFGV